jgi:hypothetical protein
MRLSKYVRLGITASILWAGGVMLVALWIDSTDAERVAWEEVIVAALVPVVTLWGLIGAVSLVRWTVAGFRPKA